MTNRKVTKNTHFLTWLWFAQPKYDQKSIKNRPKNVQFCISTYSGVEFWQTFAEI